MSGNSSRSGLRGARTPDALTSIKNSSKLASSCDAPRELAAAGSIRGAGGIAEGRIDMALSLLAIEPVWLSSILLIGVMTLIAMTGPILVRRRVSLHRLRLNNEVAGFKFATVGVLYSVLLGFSVITVWEKLNEAENAVAQEAAALATLYSLSASIEGPPGAALREGLIRYVQSAIAEEWPAMERGQEARSVTRSLNGVYAALLTFRPADTHGAMVLDEALHQLDVVTQARRTRLVLAPGTTPRVLWLVLSGGALLTIGFTLFFGSENLRAQVAMTGILSFLIFSVLLIITAIDRPFAGTVRVQPEALLSVVEDFSVQSSP